MNENSQFPISAFLYFLCFYYRGDFLLPGVVYRQEELSNAYDKEQPESTSTDTTKGWSKGGQERGCGVRGPG